MTEPAAQMPLFYKAPRPLDRAQDGALKAVTAPNFAFARAANALPLVVDEFAYAGADYPIVFAGGPQPVPVVVLGLAGQQNAFIDAKGIWRAGYYIPAYARRFPFILVEEPTSKQLLLCIEPDSAQLRPDGQLPLFNNNEPTDVTNGAMQFCLALRQQGEMTDAFIQALVTNGLLIGNQIELDLPDGRKAKLDGFQIIDRAKFMALPTDVLAEWRTKGWLDIVYAHFHSQLRWQKLALVATGAI